MKSSNNLGKYRRGCGLSQIALAGRSGVSPQYLALVEQSGRTPGLDIAVKLAKALGRPVAQVFPFIGLAHPEVDRLGQLAIKHPEPLAQLSTEQNELVLATLPLMPEDRFRQLLVVPWPTAWSTITTFSDWVKKFPATPSKAPKKKSR